MGSCCVVKPKNLQSIKKRQQQIQKIQQQILRKNTQIQKLENYNTQLKRKKQNLQINQTNKQIDQGQVQIIQFEEQSQNDPSQNNQNDNQSLEQLLKCVICEEEFNLTDKIPWMVCINQHTYCSSCVLSMLSKQKNNCPECRQGIVKGNKNLHLAMLLENLNVGIRETKGVNKGPATFMNISLNPRTPFLQDNSYEFIAPSSICKLNNHGWKGLLFNQVLPPHGKYVFCFDVITSSFNNIQIGLIDVNSKIQQGKMSNKRITFHLYDGKQMDSNGNIESIITAWRQGGGIPVPKQTQINVQVEVNMDDNEIKWFVNKNLHTTSVITNYIKYAKAVPYLSMYHMGDIVMINNYKV